MKMIRFGVIGTNWITDRLLEAALQNDDFQLTAVYSRAETKGREFAQKYGVENVFTNLEEMAKSDKIQAVYIANPNSLHLVQTINMLKNAQHNLCEQLL